ncbi:MAG: hypothetical protein V7K50_00970 [Nostoc sp.]|uniref:hypothetical protein n=1 Tax=Nostoc sp. TaxID=1180 RepID=UPI002FFC490E
MFQARGAIVALGSVSCSDPNPLQWIVIVTLVAGSGVFIVGSGVIATDKEVRTLTDDKTYIYKDFQPSP